jgi:hypothetical protein
LYSLCFCTIRERTLLVSKPLSPYSNKTINQSLIHLISICNMNNIYAPKHKHALKVFLLRSSQTEAYSKCVATLVAATSAAVPVVTSHGVIYAYTEALASHLNSVVRGFRYTAYGTPTANEALPFAMQCSRYRSRTNWDFPVLQRMSRSEGTGVWWVKLKIGGVLRKSQLIAEIRLWLGYLFPRMSGL